jgi:hypothetical protein
MKNFENINMQDLTDMLNLVLRNERYSYHIEIGTISKHSIDVLLVDSEMCDEYLVFEIRNDFEHNALSIHLVGSIFDTSSEKVLIISKLFNALSEDLYKKDGMFYRILND